MYLRPDSAFLTLFLAFFTIERANGIRTKDKMYETIDASKPCFRRLNATHQIGCSSERGGSTGVIHFCESQADLDFVLKNGTAPPYVPVLPTTLFTLDNLHQLKTSKKISGLVLYAAAQRPRNFTHERQCPNPYSSLSGTCDGDKPVWNPHGTGLLYQDIPFPVFYVETEETVGFARDCFAKHNNYSFDSQKDRSLCSLQLISFMYATTDSPTCIRRTKAGDVTNINPVKFCDPLGDQNVWASLFPLVNGSNYSEPITGFKYIVVAARMDTTSMFDNTAGAVSPVTGLAALISTAKYLKTLLPNNNNYTKNVLFLLFNGETYDYIGSQRFVYEMAKGNFPSRMKEVLPTITMDDVDLFVELSQLSNSGTVAAHYLRQNIPKKFLTVLNNWAHKMDLQFVWSEDTLPPASLHTFLKERPNITSLILADHTREYSNLFYNSVYDNATNIHYKYLNITQSDIIFDDNIQHHIRRVATMLGKSLYSEITGVQHEGTEEADLQFIDELFNCYLEDANCKIHQAVQRSQWQKQPFSLYVGVEPSSNILTTLIGLTLGWVTGDRLGESNANCTNKPRNYALRYYNMSSSIDDLNTTLCYRITMNFTEAISPAFIIDDYDWTSGKYSSWTESTWGDIKLRIFLKPSAAHENMTIAIGSMVFIFSLFFVYFVTSKSHILFTPQLPTLAPTNC